MQTKFKYKITVEYAASKRFILGKVVAKCTVFVEFHFKRFYRQNVQTRNKAKNAHFRTSQSASVTKVIRDNF